jgi:hypothetical protein
MSVVVAAAFTDARLPAPAEIPSAPGNGKDSA